MNNDAANALAEALVKHGDGMARDARLCRSLLSDLVPGRKREIRILSTAVEEGAPEELLSRASNTPETVLVESLSKRLHNLHGIDIELARWAVQSWAAAIRKASLSGGTAAGGGSSPVPAKRQTPAQSQPQVVRVLVVLGLLLVMILGAGVWMAIKLLNAPEAPIAAVDPKGSAAAPELRSEVADRRQVNTPPAPTIEPSFAERAKSSAAPESKPLSPESQNPKTTSVPPTGPDPAKNTSTPKPDPAPEVVEPKKPVPQPPPVIDPKIALRAQLTQKAAQVDERQRAMEARAALLRPQLSAAQADIKERRKLLSYLERAYQRATDEQRWPMRASGFTYSQPNAKRAMEAIAVHIGKQEEAVAALEPLIQYLGALSMEGGLLKGDIDCLSGANTDAGCPRSELTKLSADTLLRRADDYQKRVDATPKTNPPINTLDLSKIPQP